MQHPSYIMKYNPYEINIMPKMLFSPFYHKLGDRIVFINNSSFRINYGSLGTIIGIYKDRIEVLWDEP